MKPTPTMPTYDLLTDTVDGVQRYAQELRLVAASATAWGDAHDAALLTAIIAHLEAGAHGLRAYLQETGGQP